MKRQTNPDDPAFSRPYAESLSGSFSVEEPGLSKREHFAALAMQGLCVDGGSPKEITACAVHIADALIAELNKESKT